MTVRSMVHPRINPAPSPMNEPGPEPAWTTQCSRDKTGDGGNNTDRAHDYKLRGAILELLLKPYSGGHFAHTRESRVASQPGQDSTLNAELIITQHTHARPPELSREGPSQTPAPLPQSCACLLIETWTVLLRTQREESKAYIKVSGYYTRFA